MKLKSIPLALDEIDWRDASKELPSHIYSVVIWVVGCPHIDFCPFLDVGIYNAERGKWQMNLGDNDLDVEVSHWFSPRPPDGQEEA